MRRRTRVVLGYVFALQVLTVAAAIIPAPLWAMRLAARPWLLNYSDGTPNAAQGIGRDLIGLWIDKGIAARAVRDPGGDDVDRLGSMLIQMKPFVISQTEVPHGPPDARIGITGLGWCNHVNGFGAKVLSNYFPRAETFAVNLGSRSHTFARVWSSDNNEWLYFDMWADDVVIFRWRGRPEYLFRSIQAHTMTEADVSNAHQAYEHASQGYVLRRYHPTMLGQLVENERNIINHGTITAPGADAQFVPSAYPPTPTLSDTQAMDYISARFDQISGDRAAAAEHFSQIKGSGAYALAARVFARRLYGMGN